MNKKIQKSSVFLLLSLFILVSCSKTTELTNRPVQDNLAAQNSQPAMDNRSLYIPDSLNVSVSVFAPNIAFPRGLKFGPDGYLYVGLAGIGGKDSTNGECAQVVPPIGPYKSGNTASIIKISPMGAVTTVADNLPSTVNPSGTTMGVSDIEFMGDKLYALIVAGCSHGNSHYPTSVIKVNRHNGKWSVVADLSAYLLNINNAVAVPEQDDFEPDGTPYSLIRVNDNFYVVEPNHGELLKVSTDGDVSRVLDFSAHFGHIVPTADVYNDGFYVGNLRTFHLVGGSSSIYKVSLTGDVQVWATGFTGVLGVAFDKMQRLYVLETSADGGPTPNTGRVVRINSDNSRDVIIDKLFFPTGMTFGPDGALYISNTGFGPPTGQILKVVFNKKKGDNHGHDRDHDRNDRDHHNDNTHRHDN